MIDQLQSFKVLQLRNPHTNGSCLNKWIITIPTDYQPQYLTKLNQIAFYPDELFSVFDYLQDVNTHESQTVDYLDLNWPQNIRFDFTPFKIMASVNNQLYAYIILMKIVHKNLI